MEGFFELIGFGTVLFGIIWGVGKWIDYERETKLARYESEQEQKREREKYEREMIITSYVSLFATKKTFREYETKYDNLSKKLFNGKKTFEECEKLYESLGYDYRKKYNTIEELFSAISEYDNKQYNSLIAERIARDIKNNNQKKLNGEN